MARKNAAIWLKTVCWTILGPLACTTVALAYNAMMFAHDPPAVRDRVLLAAAIVSLGLSIPFFLSFSIKLRDLARANSKLAAIAPTDGLTSCLNRGAFTALVETSLEAMLGARQCGRGALLIVDVDHFKLINDKFGHQTGDNALTAIAEALRRSVRTSDSVGRLGGEEFGVYLPGIDRQGAERVAERLRQAVERIPFTVENRLHPLTVSVGGVVFDTAARFEELFARADTLLYRAKREGRNRIRMEGWRQPASALAV